MKFEEVRNEQYRAKLENGTYIWIVREGPQAWWWSLGSSASAYVWGMDSNGPFETMWEAVDDAIAAYEWLERADEVVWWVNRPTYMGRLEPPHLWRLEAVAAGSERDNMLAAGRTMTDAGEWVEIPGDWRRFTSRTEAEAWMEAEAERWEKWHSFWIA
jgi:hypothetical protein